MEWSLKPTVVVTWVRNEMSAKKHAPVLFRFLMTEQQAGVLGNYLVGLSGQALVVPSKRGWFLSNEVGGDGRKGIKLLF